MATPPPLYPRQTPGRPPVPGGDMPRRRPPRADSNRLWLILGLSIIGVGLIACIVLYFLSDAFKGIHEYDDGLTKEKVIHEDRELEIEEIPAVETPVRAVTARTVSGEGTAGGSPITLDIDVDSDGNVTGTYWNVLYCLRFSVSGRQTPDGNIDAVLAVDDVTTPLNLTTSDMRHYRGTLGNARKPVSILLDIGHRNYESPVGSADNFTGHLSGQGMNRDFRMALDELGYGWFWYPDQGYENRLEVRPASYAGNEYELCGYDGAVIATISIDTDGPEATGAMTDFSGKRFDISSFY